MIKIKKSVKLKNKPTNNTLPNDIGILMITSAIIIITVISFWCLDYKNESIIAGLIGLALWTFRTILNRYFQNIDNKVDEQKQILLQGTQTGFGFKQKVMIDMYEVTNKLWEDSIWIAMNWKALWPGYDNDKELRSAFKKKFEDYIEFLRIKSIIIPSNIYKSASKLVEGINTYEIGRMERDDKLAPGPTRKHGSEEMSNGAKLVKSSITDIFQLIRDEFGLESLPGEILKIKQPDEVQD